MRLLLTAFLIAVAAAGCGSDRERKLFTMRIPSYYWPGMYWTDVAHEKGFFREAGIDAQIIDVSGDYLGSLDRMQNGQLDTNTFNFYDILRRNLAGADLRVVFLSDTSTGADVVVARPPIRGLRDLKGARVHLGVGTYQEVILAAALAKVGLELTDVTLVPRTGDPVSVPPHVDAAVSWEPWASRAEAAGWRRIFDTSHLRARVSFGYAFRREYIVRHPDEVQKFVEVWHRTTTYMREHPAEAYDIVARKHGVSPAEAATFARLESVLDLEDNIRAFAYGAGPASIHTSARAFNRLLIAQGHASRMADSTLMVEPRFVRALTVREE